MKKLLCMSLALIILCLSLFACNEKDARVAPTMDEIDLSEIEDLSKVSVSEKETDYVKIEIQNFGTVVIRLFPEVAPATVANFKKLVSKGFYDGLLFHRVIEGFMIQGGDPKGDGTGNADEKIKGEFTENGFENNLEHVRGVVSMARATEPDSASCQFFIVQETSAQNHASLDGKYASFGYVIYGMDIVDEIAGVRTNSKDKPVAMVKMTSVEFVAVAN